ncbi:MAG4270 family putative restriction endonuclease [Metamycoplasma hyosynoviae]|uniref:MAG4270 family putative restriction endonuclease n=3 Tax=Metamycoplasma hyosynoviae TaxID=29559 RepID=UPI0023656DBA|nr:HNH endonuclease [Metamycoplasma hyosynoviae]MDD7884241.1 HNH endonuclease [Metamycoplasma hyosynoviae]MDD7893816.1 HNH endonuclease [Metamycoplasma hyosynoviae]
MDFSKELLYSCTFNFKSKNFDSKEDGSKCKGKITIYYNEGVIYKKEIWFDSLIVDLKTTASWKNSNNSNWRKRCDFFNDVLSKEPQIRKNINENDYKELDKNQLERANKWFKNRYSGTLKNVISLIKGNNPAGSFKNPKVAEIIMETDDENLKEYKYNMLMFLDLITIKQDNEFNTNNFEIESTEINEFIQSILKIKQLKEMLKITSHIDKNIEEYKKRVTYYDKRINKVKTYIKEVIYKINEVEKIIDSYRRNIKNEIVVFELGENVDSDRCHIYPVAGIKDEIIKRLYEYNKSYEEDEKIAKLLNEIKDENNLLNMSSEVHKCFDKNRFTYNKNGECKILKENKINGELKIRINQYYSIIPKEKLKRKMSEYIVKRNNYYENEI